MCTDFDAEFASVSPVFCLKNTEHKPNDIWKNFRQCWDHLHMTGYIYAGNGTRHSVKRVACPLMCSDRNVDKWNDGDWVCWFAGSGDWDLFRNEWGLGQGMDKHIQALIVELYLHVVNMCQVWLVDYDGHPVMIDRMSHFVFDIKMPSTTVWNSS